MADNRLGDIADWDLDLLSAELSELDLADFDLSLLGFESAELHDLLGQDSSGKREDEIPPVPTQATPQLGDT